MDAVQNENEMKKGSRVGAFFSNGIPKAEPLAGAGQRPAYMKELRKR
jgi:hypothetical protein